MSTLSVRLPDEISKKLEAISQKTKYDLQPIKGIE